MVIEEAGVGGIEYRTLRPEERQSFLALMELAFVDQETTHFARYLDEDPCLGAEDTLVAVAAGRLVSAVQIFTRTIRLRGEAVALGGIGSVATRPVERGRGHASELLERAIAEMQRRRMALSLLFTGRIGFYERLGWRSVPHPLLKVRREGGRAAHLGRRCEAADLPAVESLYADYSGSRDGATLRDEAYWAGQRRFAGNPDERFEVFERAGRVVAYARRIDFMTLARIMEHGCEPGAEVELAEGLLSLAPEDAPLYLPRCDDRLEVALREQGARVEVVTFPDQMWRVLDRARLARLAGAAPDVADADLLSALVGGRSAVYWPSDRF